MTEHERERESEREHKELAEKPSSLVGREAPPFEAEALMPDGAKGAVSLDDYRGRPLLLIFYQLDFSCVCPTEIVAFSDALDDFEAAGVQMLAVSVDSVYTHAAWAATQRSLGGVEGVRFPLVADLTKKIADEYGVLDCERGVAHRSLVLIDADGIVQACLVYGRPFGPSVEETLRLAKALAYSAETGETCPTDWREGDEGIPEDIDAAEDYYRERYSDEEEAELENEIEEEILEIEISEIDETGDGGDFEKMSERDEKKDEKREKKERKEEEKEEKKREKEKDK